MWHGLTPVVVLRSELRETLSHSPSEMEGLCLFCNRDFGAATALLAHRNFFHSDQPQQQESLLPTVQLASNRCSVCHKEFVQASSARRHFLEVHGGLKRRRYVQPIPLMASRRPPSDMSSSSEISEEPLSKQQRLSRSRRLDIVPNSSVNTDEVASSQLVPIEPKKSAIFRPWVSGCLCYVQKPSQIS